MVLSGTGVSARTRFLVGSATVIALLLAALALASAAVAAGAPEWKITSYAAPANLPPEGTGEIIVTAVNVGAEATDGSTITIEDTLPSTLAVTSFLGYDSYADGPIGFPYVFVAPSAELSCTTTPELVLACSRNAIVQPGDQLVMVIKVKVEPGAGPSLPNHVTVSGGGALQGDTSDNPVKVSSEPEEFGFPTGSAFAAVSSHQAGAHPNVSTGFALNELPSREGVSAEVVEEPKDIAFNLPPGLVGSAVAMPACTSASVTSRRCPAGTIVGLATTYFRVSTERVFMVSPVFNIKPSPGEPVAFMFTIATLHIRLDTTLLSNGNYGVRVTASNISQAETVLANYITIWGVPADHQAAGEIPVFGDEFSGVENVGSPSSTSPRVPLLRNPTQCSQPLNASAETDSWRHPGAFIVEKLPSMGSLTGCLEVPFRSSFSLLPDTLEAGAPAGYNFDLHVNPQELPDAPSVSDVRRVKLTLPKGVVVNPSAAWGLKACSAAEFYGPNHPSQEPASIAKCPREAQVGQVSVKTPALEEGLEGQLYLAEPECNPCTPQDAGSGRMVKLFVQLVSEGEGGIVVKLEGHGMVDQQTGQITTVFDENPQLPFSEFKLKIAGGPRSVLANPRTCGTMTANGDLEPWSILEAPGEVAVVSDSKPSYEFEINQNCFGPQFNPSFAAGMPNIQAGAYGGFTLAFGRSDSDQYLGQLTTTMPVGLLGKIAGIPLCEEAQAIAGSCASASQIGTVEALTGPGANPFLVSGGHVYLTKGYGGAPYGLSIVVPAVAGPYTLSGTNGAGSVVVRAQIFVDPHTAQLTVVSGQLPSMLDGIPLQLKAVNVRIDRPGFTFNPTSCDKLAIIGSLGAVEGMSATVSDPFQVTNCASLAFKPQFKVSAAGKTSKADGASLAVKLTYPSAPQGSEANIKSVKVDLPKQLPSRLTTLQKACTASQFDADPAGCPAASVVGHAKAITPIIPVALEGPAYFVSHGGEAFPSLIVVLQGYGVTVDLVGTTFISKVGITSSTFKQVPDVPIGSFELTLPEGKYSALAAIGNLCTSKLAMPTAFVAQNGATLHQSTPIGVTGCAKAKPPTRAQKLAKALKACKKKAKDKRARCERQASKKYASVGRKRRKK